MKNFRERLCFRLYRYECNVGRFYGFRPFSVWLYQLLRFLRKSVEFPRYFFETLFCLWFFRRCIRFLGSDLPPWFEADFKWVRTMKDFFLCLFLFVVLLLFCASPVLFLILEKFPFSYLDFLPFMVLFVLCTFRFSYYTLRFLCVFLLSLLYCFILLSGSI